MLESAVERHLKTRVAENGGEIRKVKWLDRRGAPDRLVLWDMGVSDWIELKAPGKRAEDHQEREHERLRRRGQIVLVIDTKAKVDRYIDSRLRWLARLRLQSKGQHAH